MKLLGAALIVLTLIFAVLVTGAFNTRYFYASVLGFSVLAALAGGGGAQKTCQDQFQPPAA